MDFDWKAIVKTVAPALATALGGPLAGMATQAISNAVLGSPDGTEEEIATALASSSPDTLIKLKQANLEFSAKIKELDVDLERIAQMDRADARQREIQTNDPWTPRILGATIIAGFFAAMWAVLSGEIKGMDATEMALVGAVIGYASAKADQVVSYVFGSSAGSKQKNQIIAQMEYKK